jgi:hypothetical protein
MKVTSFVFFLGHVTADLDAQFFKKKKTERKREFFLEQ